MNSIPQKWTVVLATSLLLGVLAVLGIGQVYQVQTTVTDSGGNTVATATTRFAAATAVQPTTASGSQNPAPPPSSPATLPAGNVPAVSAYPGQTYESDRWRATFAYDANGFPQPPAVPKNAVWLSSPGAPGRLASDCSDFQTAENQAWGNGSGSFYICIRDGSEFTNNQLSSSGGGSPGTWNAALQIPGGTQSHPVVITRMGVNGYQDHSAPRPIIHDQIYIGGHAYATAPGGGPAGGGLPAMNYVEIFGLDFYGDKRDPSSPTYSANLPEGYQQYAIAFIDAGNGQSDHFLVSDCRVRYYMSGFDFDGTLNTQANYTINNVWIDHPVCVGCYGARFEGYDARVRDLLVLDPVLDMSGWNPAVLPKDGSGMEHCWYSDNKDEIAGVDPQHRFVGGIFARPEAMGIKGYQGWLLDEDLFLACPIAAVCGDFNGYVSNTVVDGDPQEFDPSTVASLNGVTQTGIAGLALSQGLVGTVASPNLGNQRGWGFEWAHSPGGAATNVAFIDKNDPLNNGQAIQIQPLVAGFSGKFALSNVILSGFTEGQFNAYSPHINASANGGPNIMPAKQNITCSSCVIPNFEGGYSGIVQLANLIDPTRNISAYAKSLGVSGVTDGPSWLAHAEQNWSGSFDPRFTAAAANAWIQAGITVKN